MTIMKRLLLLLIAAVYLLPTRADEGMWIPMLIGKNYDEMVRLGLKLSKDDLYNINQSSLKDAIVQFNGGCTGEMISEQGLLITNHHCGYGAIASLSSVEKNYLDNGFWAYSHKEELPAKGVSVLFLERMEDVTGEIMDAVGKKKGEKFEKRYKEAVEKIKERVEAEGNFVASVKSFFEGNQYILLVYKKYTDVRLVGTPPRSLGKYGGDTDNWMWPRHTADFSMFRVYAGKDNEPAAYSEDNVPYKPKKFLPISIRGVEEDDYTMIFGYPGRTNRYEVSYGVDMSINETNPSIVKPREKRLEIMRKNMKMDKAVYLKLTSYYSGISNYWKYFIGQTEQLKRLKVVGQKQKSEAEFTAWAYKNAPEYKNVISDFEKIYAEFRPYARHYIYYSQAFRGSLLADYGTDFYDLYQELSKKKPDQEKIDKDIKAIKRGYKSMMRLYDEATEKEIFASMAKMFYQDIPKSQHPDVYQKVIFNNFGSNDMDKTFADYTEYVFKNTILLDTNKLNKFLENPTTDAMDNDPALLYSLSFAWNYEEVYKPKYEKYSEAKEELKKKYIRGLMEMNKGKMFYPDANSTMRITYGQVKSYSPQDAVHYDYYTTIDGLMEKYKPGDDEFDLPSDIIGLYKDKDYGKYANKNGTLTTCFITTNDITGGNSGSPIINGNGEWIGIAFDGNWEAMSGDIAFDKKYKRTICTDARFIFWIIEKMGKAHNLIEEVEMRR
ncbi:MAG: S46 family peptidase [Chitinophagales bacterium]|nr:S46 family peptidase [Chitinophagales bacterium]